MLCSTIGRTLALQERAPPSHRMNTEKAAWLANIRAEAEAPGAFLVILPSRTGSMALFADEILDKSDDELLAFIAERSAEQA
jgi:hypothetical protein